MAAIYPEHEWPVPQVRNEYKPVGYWKDLKNQRSFLDDVAKRLNLQTTEDWYTVSCSTVVKMGGTFVQTEYKGSLLNGKLNYFRTNFLQH